MENSLALVKLSMYTQICKSRYIMASGEKLENNIDLSPLCKEY